MIGLSILAAGMHLQYHSPVNNESLLITTQQHHDCYVLLFCASNQSIKVTLLLVKTQYAQFPKSTFNSALKFM